jgi:hypothetical protein
MKGLLSNARVVGMVFASETVYAKTINLYSEPKPLVRSRYDCA